MVIKHIFGLLLLGWGSLLAQEPDSLRQEARVHIAVLCSDSLAGRGYQQEGHTKAARYLARQFEALGLQPLPTGQPATPAYFQPFGFATNLVMGGSLEVDGATLGIGKDFLVDKYAGSGKAEGKLLDLGYGLEKGKMKKAAGRIVVIREGWPEGITEEQKQASLASGLDRVLALAKAGASAVILLQPKLTHGFVGEHLRIPVLNVLEASWPAQARKAALSASTQSQRIRSQNVIGYLPGSHHPDRFVVVCAHYDHLGTMGSAVFPGANDNASGTAMLLSMARHFSRPGHQPRHSMLFIAFGAEEVGLIGSNFYVSQQPIVPLDSMAFLLNLDLMGNGVDGIMAVGGKTFPERFDKLVALNDTLKAVPVVRARPNAPNSDHYWFLEKGVEGFFIYTLGGPPHYHDVNDVPANLELSRYPEVRNLLVAFLEEVDGGE